MVQAATPATVEAGLVGRRDPMQAAAMADGVRRRKLARTVAWVEMAESAAVREQPVKRAAPAGPLEPAAMAATEVTLVPAAMVVAAAMVWTGL